VSEHTTPPQFEHDCDKCTFLGRMEDGNGKPMDAYACMQGGEIPTIILRWSSEPADYTWTGRRRSPTASLRP
jgi:hypothetical protein